MIISDDFSAQEIGDNLDLETVSQQGWFLHLDDGNEDNRENVKDGDDNGDDPNDWLALKALQEGCQGWFLHPVFVRSASGSRLIALIWSKNFW